MYKRQIKNHPDSKYAEILLDPQATINGNQNSSFVYEEIYSLYESKKYLDVISDCDKNIILFNGEPIVSKLEFLKSLAIARLYGFEQYKKSLEFIKLNYSSSKEGKEAERIIEDVLPSIDNDEFNENKLSDNLGEILVPTHQVTEVKKGKRTKKENPKCWELVRARRREAKGSPSALKLSS